MQEITERNPYTFENPLNASPATRLEKSQSISVAIEVASFLEEKKAEDVIALDIDEISGFTDCFVIANGISFIQVRALAKYTEEFMFQLGYKPLKRTENTEENPWLLLDYGFIVVHLFHESKREFYQLEKIWSEGIPIYPIKDAQPQNQ